MGLDLRRNSPLGGGKRVERTYVARRRPLSNPSYYDGRGGVASRSQLRKREEEATRKEQEEREERIEEEEEEEEEERRRRLRSFLLCWRMLRKEDRGCRGRKRQKRFFASPKMMERVEEEESKSLAETPPFFGGAI